VRKLVILGRGGAGAIWGQDWSWLGENLIRRTAAAPDDIAVLAAEAVGDVVSAAWLTFSQPGADSFARLLGGSKVDASNDSAPILRRLGFRAVTTTTTTTYVWTPPQPARPG